MAQRTKGQHVVPRFYLERFTDAQGFVWNYDFPTGAVTARKPTKTAVETNFYSPVADDGGRVDAIEEMFSQIESDAAPLWDDLMHGKRMIGSDREQIALFIAMQHLRSPSLIEAAAKTKAMMHHHTSQFIVSDEHLFNREMDRQDSVAGVTTSLEKREQMRQQLLKPEDFTMEVSRHAGLPIIGGLANLAEVFVQMTWIVGASRDQHLITGDCPVTRISDPKTFHRIYGDGGFANKSVRVTLPLSSDRILELAWKGEEQERVAAVPKEMARRLNAHRATWAKRFLYASQNDTGILRLGMKWVTGEPIHVSTGKEVPELVVTRRLTQD